MPSSPSPVDQFVGGLLGQAIGDALGAPLEGLPPDEIYYQFGSSRKIMKSPPVDCLTYTDDTQMMIGVAESLLDHGQIFGDQLCAVFVANFNPERGYGAGARQILEAAAAGGDWRAVSHAVFPGGSFGNGAAMRVAPIGLFFHDDLNNVAEQAARSAIVTHIHPVGIDAARLLAIAVALAMVPGPFNRKAFLATLMAHATTDDMRYPLNIAAQLTPEDNVATLGNSVEADRSVVTSIACFAFHPDSFTEAVGRAITLGGDVDTLAAMTGVLSGTRLGVQGIPPHLLEMLEDGPKGREYIRQLAIDLAARCATR